MAKKKLTPGTGSITITNALNTNWTSATSSTGGQIYSNQGWFFKHPVSMPIGTGSLQEIEGELWWVRADGSKSCLTGKSNNFKKIYDILNDDGKEA